MIEMGAPQEETNMGLAFTYKGPAVDRGTMNVYEVATNMLAFSDYVVVAAHAEFGADAEVRADVSGFSRGSFTTELLFQVAGVAGTLLSVQPDFGGFLETVKQSLDLFKFLKGHAPTETQQIDDHSINVTNIAGDVSIVKIEALHVTMDPKAGAAAEKFLSKALNVPGLESVQICSGEEPVATVTSEEARFYHPIERESVVVETVSELALIIEAINFGEGKKWRFWDGANSIPLSVEDEEFNAKISNGEPFRKGDSLICDVRSVQTQRGGNLKVDRTIIKVKSHQHKFGDQQKLI